MNADIGPRSSNHTRIRIRLAIRAQYRNVGNLFNSKRVPPLLRRGKSDPCHRLQQVPMSSAEIRRSRDRRVRWSLLGWLSSRQGCDMAERC